MFSYTPTFYTSKSSSHILRGYIFKTWPGNQFLLQHFSICHWTEGWQSGHETKLTPGLCIFDGRPFINRLPPLLVIHSNAPRFRPLFLSIVSSDLVSLVLILSQFLHCFPLFFHLHGSFVILPGPCCPPPFTRLIYSSLSLSLFRPGGPGSPSRLRLSSVSPFTPFPEALSLLSPQAGGLSVDNLYGDRYCERGRGRVARGEACVSTRSASFLSPCTRSTTREPARGFVRGKDASHAPDRFDTGTR